MSTRVARRANRVPTRWNGRANSSLPLRRIHLCDEATVYERLNAKRDITDTFENAGFSTIATELIVQQIAPTHAAYADKLAAGGDSILASLDAEDLEEGLKALRRHAALVDPKPVTELIDVFIFRHA